MKNKITSINIWQRTNDGRYSVCMTKTMGQTEDFDGTRITPTMRLQFTSDEAGLYGFNEALDFINRQKEVSEWEK